MCFAVGLLQNVIVMSPYVFLRLSETSVGEIDMMLIPTVSNYSANPFINFTAINQTMFSVGIPTVESASPR